MYVYSVTNAKDKATKQANASCHLTAAMCPCKTCLHFPVSMSHTRRDASLDPLTTAEQNKQYFTHLHLS